MQLLGMGRRLMPPEEDSSFWAKKNTQMNILKLKQTNKKAQSVVPGSINNNIKNKHQWFLAAAASFFFFW